MIRFTLVMLVLGAISVYAWRDWYTALCGLILVVGVVQHPDFPNSMGGIQGANPWNLALASIVLAWWSQRQRDGVRWDMPGYVNALLCVYLAVVLVSWLRLAMGRTIYLSHLSSAYLVSEYLVNCLKWVVPGLLLFDGCRDRRRLLLGVGATLGLYVVLALQVIRWMPPSMMLDGEALADRSLKILVNEIGFHRVNLSMMLAGASWAIFACLVLAKRRVHQILLALVGVAVVYGQALTAGRTGYVTWAVVGLGLCAIKWRKYLLLGPVVALMLLIAVPGAIERLSQGFGGQEVDRYVVTAGRNIAWPVIIDKITDSPLVGYGRQAMQRTGLAARLWNEHGESFPHPHNAYLEMLLDNGAVGFLLVMPFYVVILVHAIRLFRDRRDPMFQAVGGMTCALVLALLVAAVGSQTFYPREGAVGMWCAMGLMLRLWVVRSQMPAAVPAPAAYWPGDAEPAMAGPPDAAGPVPPDGRDWWRPDSAPARPEAAGDLVWNRS